MPVTRRFAPVPADPPPPKMRTPIRVLYPAVVRELALRTVAEVIVPCFPLMADTRLVPPTVKVPFSTVAPSACSSPVAMRS